MEAINETPPGEAVSASKSVRNGAGNDLRQEALNWTLDSEYKLMQKMEDLHNRLLSSSKELVGRVEVCSRRAGQLSVNVASASNNFNALADTQFIESRVRADSNVKADLFARQHSLRYNSRHHHGSVADRYKRNTSTKTVAESERERLESVKQALQICSTALDSELGSITPSINGELAYEVKDRYATRPLPAIIGTAAFINEKYAGADNTAVFSAKFPAIGVPNGVAIRYDEKASRAALPANDTNVNDADSNSSPFQQVASPTEHAPNVPVAAPRHRRPSVRNSVEAASEVPPVSVSVAEHARNSDIFDSPSPSRHADDRRTGTVSANQPSSFTWNSARAPLLFGDSGESEDEESPIFASASSVAVSENKNADVQQNRSAAANTRGSFSNETTNSVDANASAEVAPVKKVREHAAVRTITVANVDKPANIPPYVKRSAADSLLFNDGSIVLATESSSAVATGFSKDLFKASLNATLGRRQQMLPPGSTVNNLPTADNDDAAEVSPTKADPVREKCTTMLLPSDAGKRMANNSLSSTRVSTASHDAAPQQKLMAPVRTPSSSGVASSTTSSASTTSAEVGRGRTQKPAALFDATDDENIDEDDDDSDDLFAAVSRRRFLANPTKSNVGVVTRPVPAVASAINKPVPGDEQQQSVKINAADNEKVNVVNNNTDADVRRSVPSSEPLVSNAAASKPSTTALSHNSSNSVRELPTKGSRSLNVNSIFNDAHSSDSDENDDDSNDLFVALARASKEKRSKPPLTTLTGRSSPHVLLHAGQAKQASPSLVTNTVGRVINDDRESFEDLKIRNERSDAAASKKNEQNFVATAGYQIPAKEMKVASWSAPSPDNPPPRNVPNVAESSLTSTAGQQKSGQQASSSRTSQGCCSVDREDIIFDCSINATNFGVNNNKMHAVEKQLAPPLVPKNMFSDDEERDTSPKPKLFTGGSETSRASLPFNMVSVFRRSPPPPDDAAESEDDANALITPTVQYNNFWHDEDQDTVQTPRIFLPASLFVKQTVWGTTMPESEKSGSFSTAVVAVDHAPKVFDDVDSNPFGGDAVDEKMPSDSSLVGDNFHSALSSFTALDQDQHGSAEATMDDKLLEPEAPKKSISVDNVSSPLTSPSTVTRAPCMPQYTPDNLLLDQSIFNVPKGFYDADDDSADADNILHANKSLGNITTAGGGGSRLSRSRSGVLGGSSRVSQTRLQHLLDRKLKILSKHDSPVDVRSASPFLLDDTDDLVAVKYSGSAEILPAPSTEKSLRLNPVGVVATSSVKKPTLDVLPLIVSLSDNIPTADPLLTSRNSTKEKIGDVTGPVYDGITATKPRSARVVSREAELSFTQHAESSALTLPKRFPEERNLEPSFSPKHLISSTTLQKQQSQLRSTDSKDALSVVNQEGLRSAANNDAVFDPLRLDAVPSPTVTPTSISRAVTTKVDQTTAKLATAFAPKHQQNSLASGRRPFLFDADDDDDDENLFSSVLSFSQKPEYSGIFTTSEVRGKPENAHAFRRAEVESPSVQQVVSRKTAKLAAPVAVETKPTSLLMKHDSRMMLHEQSDDGEDDDLFATLTRKKRPTAALSNGMVSTNNNFMPTKMHSQALPAQAAKSVPNAVVGAAVSTAGSIKTHIKLKPKSIFGDDDGDDDLFSTSVVKKNVKK